MLRQLFWSVFEESGQFPRGRTPPIHATRVVRAATPVTPQLTAAVVDLEIATGTPRVYVVRYTNTRLTFSSAQILSNDTGNTEAETV